MRDKEPIQSTGCRYTYASDTCTPYTRCIRAIHALHTRCIRATYALDTHTPIRAAYALCTRCIRLRYAYALYALHTRYVRAVYALYTRYAHAIRLGIRLHVPGKRQPVNSRMPQRAITGSLAYIQGRGAAPASRKEGHATQPCRRRRPTATDGQLPSNAPFLPCNARSSGLFAHTIVGSHLWEGAGGCSSSSSSSRALRIAYALTPVFAYALTPVCTIYMLRSATYALPYMPME